MAKNKLKRFAENLTFSNLLQPELKDLLQKDLSEKGNWEKVIFKNNHPIILELGCGKGEYAIGLAEKNPTKNFIGIDFKGARIWRGAKTALEKNLENIFFVRTKIDMIEKIFDKNEISEIWITFADPQLTKDRKKLTSPFFIKRYLNILKPNGIIHLKTDSIELFNYTLSIVDQYKFQLIKKINNIYQSSADDDITGIQTFYEKMFIAQNKEIHYLSFSINTNSADNKDISFFEKVFEVVRQIPYGRVTSYGAIAEYLSIRGSARMVGWAMNHAHSISNPVPAHRVVNRNGMLTGKHHFGGSTVMQELLENEGLKIKDDKIIHFEKHFWDPEKELH